MTITRFGHPDSYRTIESFCKKCGRTILQYIDYTGKDIIIRENWETPTGWLHKSDLDPKCGEEYIENDKDFPITHFKTRFDPDYKVVREKIEILWTLKSHS